MSELAIDRNRNPDILTPNEVALLMPPSVPKSWIYAHWGELGGVKIGRRKLILREVFYANFQKEGLVVCTDRQKRGEMDSLQSRHGSEQVENEKRGETRGGKIAGMGGKVENHSNEFGLVDALQRIP